MCVIVINFPWAVYFVIIAIHECLMFYQSLCSYCTFQPQWLQDNKLYHYFIIIMYIIDANSDCHMTNHMTCAGGGPEAGSSGQVGVGGDEVPGRPSAGGTRHPNGWSVCSLCTAHAGTHSCHKTWTTGVSLYTQVFY